MSSVTNTGILDIGCGNNKRDPTALGLDLRNYDAVDVVADLDSEDGLPFESDRFTEILAFSILEHVEDLPAVMEEIHRIGKDGATVRGKVPHWKDRNAHIDPTHSQLLDERSFDYWDSTTEFGQLDYFDAEFRVQKAKRIRRVKFWKSRPIEFELEVIK